MIEYFTVGVLGVLGARLRRPPLLTEPSFGVRRHHWVRPYGAEHPPAGLRPHHRETTGVGQRVDVSLFEAALSVLANQAACCLLPGVVPQRHGNGHLAIVPFDVFDSLDGSVMICVGNDGQLRKLCALLHVPDLGADPRFATNPARVAHRAELRPLLDRLFASVRSQVVLAGAERTGVPIGPFAPLDAMFDDPRVGDRDMLIAKDHPTVGEVRQVGSPIKPQATPASLQRPPPLLGQHTSEVLSEGGFSRVEIATLLAPLPASADGPDARS